MDGYEQTMMCPCQYERVVQSILKNSGFPYEEFKRMTFNTFEDETEEQKAMKKLAIKFIRDDGQWLGIFGASGAGKTHLCIAVCQELVELYRCSFKYVSYRSMMRQLRSKIFDDEGYSDIMHDLIETDVLYIDDLLKFSLDQKGEIIQEELRILYDIINERYLRRKKTIFSSEYTMKEIVAFDEALGSRMRELIGEYGIKCSGSNYRLGGKR